MQTQLVVTFITDDRPGIVEDLSELVSGHAGNWLESRMSCLAGKFAGIVRCSVPHERAGAAQAALRALAAEGFTVSIEAAGTPPSAAGSAAYVLDIVGHDRPGIVREFATALAHRGINVFDMRSDITSAPMSGGPLFTARAEIHLPAGLDLDELREHLEAIADDLMIEYTLDRKGA